LAETLIARRDLIGRYWFKQANPLDQFQLFEAGDGSYELRFEDLAVRYGFEPDGTSVYRFEVIGKNGNRGVRLAQEEIQETVFKISSDWLTRYPSLDLLIRTRRQGEKDWSPFVAIEVHSEGGRARIARILHQD